MKCHLRPWPCAGAALRSGRAPQRAAGGHRSSFLGAVRMALAAQACSAVARVRPRRSLESMPGPDLLLYAASPHSPCLELLERLAGHADGPPDPHRADRAGPHQLVRLVLAASQDCGDLGRGPAATRVAAGVRRRTDDVPRPSVVTADRRRGRAGPPLGPRTSRRRCSSMRATCMPCSAVTRSRGRHVRDLGRRRTLAPQHGRVPRQGGGAPMRGTVV
jgi:hypothetical protein